MKKGLVTLIIILLSGIYTMSTAQVLTSEPVYPTATDEIILYYDASEGNGELAGFTGDIWAHTGVITNKSTSPSDWKYVIARWSENTDKAKLERISGDLYKLTITPNILNFYSVPDGEEVLQMAFVFRNSDGTKVGRAEGGGDIYYDVYKLGLNISLTSPEYNYLIVKQNDTIFIHGDIISIGTTENPTISIFHDDSLVNTYSDLKLDDTIPVKSNGNHYIKIIAENASYSDQDSISYYVRSNSVYASLPANTAQGINYVNDTTVTLVLLAPFKEFCYVLGDFNSWELNEDYLMNKTPDSTMYWITVTGLEAGKEYIFQYFVDGQIQIADPLTEKTSDPWNDKYISDDIYPNLIDYPEGKADNVASTFQTMQDEYQWEIDSFVPPPVDKLVIYELHIRDFVQTRYIKTVMDTLSYLENLGVNAIELMPINEFEGNDSWGYNPSFYFAPDKAYGTKNDYKRFIDECHKRGIAVIIDMVLNHSYGLSPMVRLYWDDQNNRIADNNPWYNVVSPNPVFAWGYDFNHESKYTQDFVDSVNTYWLEYYKVDGFRFDFTKGFTNKPGDGWSYDASRISILKRMGDHIWNFDNDALLILEHFTENTEEIELSNYGFLIWGIVNYNYNKATEGWVDMGSSDFSWGSYKTRGWAKPHLVSYMESHDEQRLMYNTLQDGNSASGYNTKDLNIALQRMEQAATFFITIPGPKMIWQFGELGYDISIDYDCRVCPKPVKWNYFEENNRKRLYQVYEALIKLKLENEAFSSSDYTLDVKYGSKSIKINHSSMNVNILGNFDVVPVDIDPDFQTSGYWYEYFSGESTFIGNTNDPITFAPGEYRIYTTKQLEKPDIIADSHTPVKSNTALSVYPNPSNNSFNIQFANPKTGNYNIEIVNIQGQTVKELHNGSLHAGNINVVWDGTTSSGSIVETGIYFCKFMDDSNIYIEKLIKY